MLLEPTLSLFAVDQPIRPALAFAQGGPNRGVRFALFMFTCTLDSRTTRRGQPCTQQ